MILSGLVPTAEFVLDLESADASARLADEYRPPRAEWMRLNLIASIGGSAVGTDGTSETLTNAADRAILRAIRSLADVVLVGAASIRAEGYFVPRKAALAVVTSSGNLAGHRITATGERGPLLVLCPASAVDAALASAGDLRVEIVVVADQDGRLAPADVLTALRSRGLASVVCEGGPGLAAQLLEARVVDELCLSTSAQIGGPFVPLFGTTETEPQRLRLSALLTDRESGLYARWRPAGD